MNKRWMWIGGAFLLGVVFASKARMLPLLNKLPSA
jgi:hypothetical protein